MNSCPKCGYKSDTERGVKIHYGRSHEGTISGTEVECSTCGEAFRKQTSHAEEYDRHFCSTECKSEAYKNHVTLTCDECGVGFSRNASHASQAERHYCSTECKGIAYRDRVEFECLNCGEAFERFRSAAERTNRPYCSYECLHSHFKGSNHPRWEGGGKTSDVLRRVLADTSWYDLKSTYRERFDQVCRMCGSEGDLHIHHIVPLMAGGTHHPDNLMVLCVSCHSKSEQYTRGLFDYPIAEAVSAA